MQTTGALDCDFVLVEHEFEYTSKDGSVISIKPNERYMLLKRTNEHWWFVCKDTTTKPFFIPAKYVKLLLPASGSPNGLEPFRDCPEDVIEHVPGTQYSYTFLPADPHPSGVTNPLPANNQRTGATRVPQLSNARTLPADKAQRVSMLLFGSSTSLSDISVACQNPAKEKLQIFSEDGAQIRPLASLRTFHNSKKILDPQKRISVMFPPRVEPTIRSTQSLNDLQSVNEEDDPAHVYANLEDFRKGDVRQRLSSQHRSSTSTIDEWETHTDQGSGHLFYYNCVTGETTWDCPFEQSEEPLHSPLSPSSTSPVPEEWERHFDESSGQFYFYNSVTRETSWEPPMEDELHLPERKEMFSPYGSEERRPPTPEADYPEYTPEDIENYPEADYDGFYIPPPPGRAPSDDHISGWSCHINPEGQKLYTNSYNDDTWLQSQDKHGKTYFYTPDGSLTQWNLPQLTPPDLHTGNSSNPDQNSNWPHHVTENKGLEKAGVLHKTKTAVNGRRLRKNWSSSWTVLEGGILTFFKDAKNLSSNSLRQSLLTTAEHTLRLQGATLGWATKEKSSKKHVMELKTRDGAEYLVHHDSETITKDWFTAIRKSIGKNAHVSSDCTSETEAEPVQEFGSTERLGIKEEKKSPGHSTNSTDSDRKVRAKLRKFLQRRPTLQSLRDKGYIRDQVFGCHLQQLCEREKRNVPHYVSKSIEVVEKRGLDIDGLYRISGNLAVIQKLRYKVDHDENFSLDDGRWEDIHVITGALKLFFRELPEPLFPFSHFDRFVEAIKLTDHSQKIRRLKDLVLSLPPPNLETMRLLFRHLCSVIEHKDSNRMSVQSVAIVFGPTLLKPEVEGGNIAMYMVFQNQIVEQILNQYKYIFTS